MSSAPIQVRQGHMGRGQVRGQMLPHKSLTLLSLLQDQSGSA